MGSESNVKLPVINLRDESLKSDTSSWIEARKSVTRAFEEYGCFLAVHDKFSSEACTEMVMPMTCSNESMFPPSPYSYEEFAVDCVKQFGVRPREHWITTEFGGKRIKQVLKRFGSNIIFSNGMQDPWSRGSVLNNISSSIVALVTKSGAHHVDFRSATKEDPDWLINQRLQEVEIIQKWFHEYYADSKQD